MRPEARGSQLFVSRSSPDFLKELFRIEVPEIGEEMIEIMGAPVIRVPAPRSRSRPTIVVSTRSVPVSACVVPAFRPSPPS